MQAWNHCSVPLNASKDQVSPLSVLLLVVLLRYLLGGILHYLGGYFSILQELCACYGVFLMPVNYSGIFYVLIGVVWLKLHGLYPLLHGFDFISLSGSLVTFGYIGVVIVTFALLFFDVFGKCSFLHLVINFISFLIIDFLKNVGTFLCNVFFGVKVQYICTMYVTNCVMFQYLFGILLSFGIHESFRVIWVA